MYTKILSLNSFFPGRCKAELDKKNSTFFLNKTFNLKKKIILYLKKKLMIKNELIAEDPYQVSSDDISRTKSLSIVNKVTFS